LSNFGRDDVIDDLESRLRNTRWPEAELRVSRKDLKLPRISSY
jgi:hypothetical protein